MKRIMGIFLLTMVYLGAGEIKIAVAANVSYAIDALKDAFHEKYPGTEVKVMLGSSGKLTAQIMHGAPYELFMSANMMYPERLYSRGMALGKPVVYARGGLAYLSVKQYDLSRGMKLLTDKTVGKIAIANPKTAPYGVAAAEALRNGGIYNKVKRKFVYGESVSQTVTYAMKAADIGLVAKSALFSPQMKHLKEGSNWADVDASLYTPIAQGMVILKEGKGNEEVKAFYDFMLSREAKDILHTYGYKI
jgi:molybdate transport system substrate-binding protein